MIKTLLRVFYTDLVTFLWNSFVHTTVLNVQVPSEPRRIQILFDFFHVIRHICFFKLENCSLYKEKNNTIYLFLVSKPQLFRLFYEYGVKIETFRCGITMKLV